MCLLTGDDGGDDAIVGLLLLCVGKRNVDRFRTPIEDHKRTEVTAKPACTVQVESRGVSAADFRGVSTTLGQNLAEGRRRSVQCLYQH
jgi:hypothetical protein